MRLTVVGCAGSYPNAQSAGSAYLLEHESTRIVLDLGSGALGALQQHVDLDDPEALAAVVLSHCHVDHCADVASLYVLRHYGPSARAGRLPLLGPLTTGERIAAIYGMASPADVSNAFELATFGSGPVEIGPFRVTVAPAAHPVEAYCVRVEAGGRSITYSGDTGPTPALAELARGTDVALFEASFVGEDNPANLHLTGADAGRAAAEAGAGMLLLTHHVAWNDPADVLREARSAFDGPIEQAYAGMIVSI
jgi:ribonuclease BN (tRNA processing enzyme)